jgi:hypothetical protein
MSLFKEPLIVPGQSVDYRYLKGFVNITVPDHQNYGITTIKDLENAGATFLECHISSRNEKISLGNVDGIFYHHKRKKWIVFYGTSVSSTRQIDPRSGTVWDDGIERVQSLGLRFPLNHVDFLDPDKLSCARVPLFFGDGKYTACWPWINDYVDLINLSKLETQEYKLIYDESKQEIRGILPLLGNIDYNFSIASNNIVKEQNPFLCIWPNLPDWKAYWVRSSFAMNDSTVPTNWDLTNYKRDEENLVTKTKTPSHAKNFSFLNEFEQTSIVDDWPILVHFSKSSQKNVGGFIYVPPPNKSGLTSTSNSTIGIDFGTFRTVVMVQNSNDVVKFEDILHKHYTDTKSNQINSQQTIQFEPSVNKVLIGDKFLDPEFIGYLNLPPTYYNSNLIQSRLKEGPSVFLTQSLIGHQFSDYQNLDNQGDSPFVTYTLPFNMRTHNTENTSKWNLRNKNSTTKNFLKSILLLASVEQQVRSPGSSCSYVISYPLAFSNEEKNTLIELAIESADWVNSCLPSTVNLTGGDNGKPKVYSESEAAYTIAGANSNDKTRIIIVADVGGGTLDLSIWKLSKSEQPLVLVADSVRIGANTVSDKYVSLYGGNNSLKMTQQTNFKIISEGYEGLRNSHREDPQWRDSFEPHIEKWLNAIIEYSTRTLASVFKNNEIAEKTEEINFVLVGSGWKSVAALGWTIDTLVKYIKDQINLNMYHLNVIPSKRMQTILENTHVLAKLIQTGLEKIAIAGGLVQLGNDASPSTEGIFSPNGIDESGQNDLHWYTIFSDVHWNHRYSIKFENKNFVPPLLCIPKNNNFNNEDIKAIEFKINKNKKRNKTALAVIMEDLLVLAPKIN